MRVVIGGWPRTGKTTMARGMVNAGEVRHTDHLIAMGWSEASAAAVAWLDEPGPWVVEGTTVVRALRKWLDANKTGKPCDKLYWLTTPRVGLSRGQATMGKGCDTVLAEIKAELEYRGVKIVYEAENAS